MRFADEIRVLSLFSLKTHVKESLKNPTFGFFFGLFRAKSGKKKYSVDLRLSFTTTKSRSHEKHHEPVLRKRSDVRGNRRASKQT